MGPDVVDDDEWTPEKAAQDHICRAENLLEMATARPADIQVAFAERAKAHIMLANYYNSVTSREKSTH